VFTIVETFYKTKRLVRLLLIIIMITNANDVQYINNTMLSLTAAT